MMILVLLVTMATMLGNVQGQEEGCAWQWGRVIGYSIAGYNDEGFNKKDMTEDECKEACELATTFECVSLDYSSPKECYLSSKRSEDVGDAYAATPGWVYYERRYECPKGCAWQWSRVEGYGIAGYNDQGFNKEDMTEDECKEACELAITFECASLEYSSPKECYLSSKRAEDVGDAYAADPGWVYYERRYECPKVCAWQWGNRVEGYGITGYNDQVFDDEDMTEDECKEACESATTFECASLEYSSPNLCYLTSKRAEDVGDAYAAYPGWVYYERRYVC